MSVLSEEALNELKWNYNHNLTRYYKGCEYFIKHNKDKDRDKWLPELFNILDNMNLLLEEIMKHQKVSNEQILYGFIKERK